MLKSGCSLTANQQPFTFIKTSLLTKRWEVQRTKASWVNRWAAGVVFKSIVTSSGEFKTFQERLLDGPIHQFSALV